MAVGFTYTFPALRGVQAEREYFVAMSPLKLLPKIFIFNDAELPAELRAQRTLNTARIPEIAKYITANRGTYAFSALTASIDGEMTFEPLVNVDGNAGLGLLNVSMSARFVINDGQHRQAAIEAALEEDPSLGDETIAVVFFQDSGLKRSQQLFADLNKYAVKPTKSISVLYDQRDPLAGLARDLADSVSLFKGLTEMERTTISNRSIALFTLSAIYQATLALLGKRSGDAVSRSEKRTATAFWEVLVTTIPEWGLAVDRKLRSAELRQNFVHSHGVTLHALGLAGRRLIELHPSDWQDRLEPLRELDWRRANAALWEGRAMSGGQMSKARQNVQLTANLLITTLGIGLTDEEAQIEKNAQVTRRAARARK